MGVEEEVEVTVEVGGAEGQATVLVGAEEVSGSTQTQVGLGQGQAIVVGGEEGESFRRGASVMEAEAEARARAASDASTHLVQAGQAEAIGIDDDQAVSFGHVDADLDHRGRDQDIAGAGSEVVEGGLLGRFAQAAVDQGQAFAQGRAQVAGQADGVMAIAIAFLAEGADHEGAAAIAGTDVADQGVHAGPGLDTGGHRSATRWPAGDAADRQVAEDRERQGAGNRRGGQGEEVRTEGLIGSAPISQAGTLVDTEAVLLVDDHQATAAGAQILVEEGVGADQQVAGAVGEGGGEGGPLGRRGPAGEEVAADTAAGQPGREGALVLAGEEGRGGEQEHLAAIGDDRQGGEEGDGGLAAAHIPLDQAVRRLVGAQIAADLGEDGLLSRGEREGQAGAGAGVGRIAPPPGAAGLGEDAGATLAQPPGEGEDLALGEDASAGLVLGGVPRTVQVAQGPAEGGGIQAFRRIGDRVGDRQGPLDQIEVAAFADAVGDAVGHAQAGFLGQGRGGSLGEVGEGGVEEAVAGLGVAASFEQIPLTRDEVPAQPAGLEEAGLDAAAVGPLPDTVQATALTAGEAGPGRDQADTDPDLGADRQGALVAERGRRSLEAGDLEDHVGEGAQPPSGQDGGLGRADAGKELQGGVGPIHALGVSGSPEGRKSGSRLGQGSDLEDCLQTAIASNRIVLRSHLMRVAILALLATALIAAEGDVRVITSAAQFDETIAASKDQGATVVVDFHAEWCGPCKMLTPILNEVAQENPGKVTVLKVDVDAVPDLAQRFKVMSIPFLVKYDKGERTGDKVGLLPKDQLKAWIGL